MENFEDFFEYYGTKPKNVATTTSTTSTTRFDSTAKRNNNYKSTAPENTESAFAVEELAPASIKKASVNKAGFESYTPKAVNEKAIDERKKREQNARTVNKTVNSDIRDNAKQLQKKFAQLERQEAADKAVDEKYRKGTADRLKDVKYDMDVLQQMNNFAKRNPKEQVIQTEAEAKAESEKQKRYEERLNNAKNPTALPKFNNSTAAAVEDIVNPNSRVVKNSIETERDIDEAKKLNEARIYRNKILASQMTDDEVYSEAKKNTTKYNRYNVSSALDFSDNDDGRRRIADNELNLRRYNALPQDMQQQIYYHLNGGTPIIRDNFVADIESSGVMTAKDAEELLDWAEGKYVEGNRFSYDDIAKLDTSNGTGFYQFLYACRTLTEIPPLDTSKGISFRQMFDTCNALVTIPPIDFSNGTDFWGCQSLKNISFIGTINANINFGHCISLSVESILNIFNALVDLSSTTSKTLTLGDTNLEKVTETQLAIAINKNWTVN